MDDFRINNRHLTGMSAGVGITPSLAREPVGGNCLHGMSDESGEAAAVLLRTKACR